MACYYCIVNASNTRTFDTANENKLKAYYNALAREKNNLVKLSDYVNGSETQ